MEICTNTTTRLRETARKSSEIHGKSSGLSAQEQTVLVPLCGGMMFCSKRPFRTTQERAIGDCHPGMKLMTSVSVGRFNRNASRATVVGRAPCLMGTGDLRSHPLRNWPLD